MSRVTSLTQMPEAQLNRWIRRIALLFVVVLIAFVAFYVFDRYNPIPQPSQTELQVKAAEAKVQTDPADLASRGVLADLYGQIGRWQDAIAQYDAIIATGKGEELARIGRAKAYEALKQPDVAAADWQRVVDIASVGEMANVDPNLALAYYRLGMIAITKGDTQGGITNLEKSLAITRTDADTLVALGAAYMTAGDVDKAITSYKKAAAFVPVGWADPYTGLAAAYAKKGDTAMATWATAMAANANQDYTTAEAQLKTLLGGPADLDAAMGLGLVAESKGEGQDAVEWYQHVLDKDPQNQAAMLALSRVRPVAPGATPVASPAASQEGQN